MPARATLYFQRHGKVGSAVCADVSPQMGAICRDRLLAGGFDAFTGLQVDDYPLPLATATFDAVLCFETVEHVAQPERLVAELGRVTKPGGVLILTTPNVLWEPVQLAGRDRRGSHHSEGPHRFIRYRRLTRMIEAAGFQIERAETTVFIPGGPPAPGPVRRMVRGAHQAHAHALAGAAPRLWRAGEHCLTR